MQKKFKKVLSVFLAVIMTLSICTVAFAQDNTVQTQTARTFNDVASTIFADTDGKNADWTREEPVANIIFPGISQSISTYCDENGNPIKDSSGKVLSGGLLIIDTSNLVSMIVKELLVPLLNTIVMRKTYKRMEEKVKKVVDQLFYIQKTDKTGKPEKNLVVNRYDYPLSQFNEGDRSWFYRMFPMQCVMNAMQRKYGVNGEDYTYLYTFPLIGDPIQSAQGIQSFIDMVKQQTGVKKVNLIQLSMGGTMMTTYLDLVRENGGTYKDINKIINVVGCLDGTDIIADNLNGDVDFSDKMLYEDLIPAVFEANNLQPYLAKLVQVLLKVLFTKDSFRDIARYAIEGIVDTLMVNCPSFWSMCPSDRYEQIANKRLVGDEYKVLRAKTDRFQTARLNLKSNLAEAEKQGVEVYFVGGYNRTYFTGDYNFFGMCESSKTTNSDSVIDIDSTTLGTTYAPAGTKLDDAYISSLSTTKYVSPDGSIDASTCYAPDRTWFFNGQHHEVGRDDAVLRLLSQIVVGNIKDINSDPNFPQFNGSRFSRELFREGWAMDKAKSLLDSSKGTEKQRQELQRCFDAGKSFITPTLMADGEDARRLAVENDLRNAIHAIDSSLDSGAPTPSGLEKILNKLLTGKETW